MNIIKTLFFPNTDVFFSTHDFGRYSVVGINRPSYTHGGVISTCYFLSSEMEIPPLYMHNSTTLVFSLKQWFALMAVKFQDAIFVSREVEIPPLHMHK